MAPRRPSRRRTPPRRQPTTVQKGYGQPHRRLREQTKKLVDRGGAVCWRCRQWIEPGSDWQLGHADAPGAKALGLYRGAEHRSCSRTAVGWKRVGVTHAPPPPARRAQPRAKALDFFNTRPENASGTT